MEQHERHKQRVTNFKNAYATFMRIAGRYENAPDDEVAAIALVHSYECVIELAWKVMKDALAYEKFPEPASPRSVIRLSLQAGYIEDGETWLRALDMRNLTSHTYSKHILKSATAFIYDTFLPLLRTLNATLTEKAW